MTHGWNRVPIKTVYTGLFDGPHATPKPSAEGPVFLGIKNISEDGHLVLDETRHIAEEDFAKWTRRVCPQKNDIVFTYEATLNLYALIPEGLKCCLGRRLALIRPDQAKVDPQYLYFYFFSEDWRKTVATKTVIGSTVDRIPLIEFPDFPINLPSLPTQRKIAGILSAYDDLIENNTRRIAILEEMAQAIYREWFVHFRFPGHEQVRLVDSPLGKIPEGWEATTLGEVVSNFDRLRKPLSSMQRADMKGEYPYYGAAKIFDYINNYIFDGKFLLFAEDGSVITPDRKPVLQMAYGRFWVNNHAHILQGNPPVCTEHLCLSLSFTDVSGYVTGAAQPKITKANMNRMPFLVATDDVQAAFTEFVVPIFDERHLLDQKNANLRSTRDLLLPKLISGQLDVEDLDIDPGQPLDAVAP